MHTLFSLHLSSSFDISAHLTLAPLAKLPPLSLFSYPRVTARTEAMDYYFSVVKDVLPEPPRGGVLPARRQYIPKGCQPHVCTTAERGAAPWLGGCPVRLRGDGTTARAKASQMESPDEARDATTDAVGLGSLVTVDAETGTRCVCYTPATDGTTHHDLSSPVPSGRRLVSLVSTTTAALSGGATLHALYASDDKGNLYRFRPGLADTMRSSTVAAKHTRREGEPSASVGRGGSAGLDADEWHPIAPARSPVPSQIVEADTTAGVSSALFSHALGAPGWAGLVPLENERLLVCAREHYQDLRVVDVERGEVVRAYATTHAPTGLICPGRTSWTDTPAQATASSTTELSPHVVLVAEGCLATLFDVRCPSAVVSLSATLTPVDAVDTTTHTEAEVTAVPAYSGPLVPGRLNSVSGQVRDVCNTVHPFEVAVAMDRALCVYDYRKFNRAFSSLNVLKYTIASIAPFAGGRAVVCSGVDAEVRIIALHGKETLYTTQGEPLSLTANQAAASRPAGKSKGKDDAGAPASEDPTGSTFRTRLNSSVSCASTWQGSWVSAIDGRIAVGISMDNELFLVQ